MVDNGSTDATKEIIHSFKDRLPLTYAFEAARGKNVALNTGLANVEGDLVVLTDDDIVPRSDWLEQLRLAADSHPEFSLFGGPVTLRWKRQPADWILSWVKLSVVFARTDPDWEEGPIRREFVFGGNMAIRASVFSAGYRFNPGIGPKGNSYGMGSESELTMRLGKAGIKAWHCKQAVVEHLVREFQMTRAWILGRAVRFGRGRYRTVFQHDQVNREKCLGIPRHLIKEAVKEGLKVGACRLLGDEARLFKKRWTFNCLVGQMIEARLIHRELHSATGVRRLRGGVVRDGSKRLAKSARYKEIRVPPVS